MNDTAKDQLRAFQLKGSLLTLTVLELLKTDMSAIRAQLLSLVKQTPDLFNRMPVIVDLNKVAEAANQPDFSALKSILHENGFIPVGIRGGSTTQQHSASEAGFALFNNTRNETAEKIVKTEQTLSKAPDPKYTHAKLVNQPVRSGQQIFSKNDLIILSSVSPGAEVLADGNIHIYGALKGRAMAGVNGNKEARIFCQKLEAELVSIAGHYWVNEDIAPMADHQTIQIYLENDRLQIKIV